MGLRQAKKTATRLRILEIAEERFRANGYDETPIREIAARAGLSVQTLYNYFSSKEGILTGIFAERQKRLAAAAEALTDRFLTAADAPGTQVERFLHLVRWGLRGLAADRAFMRLLYLNAWAVRGGAYAGEKLSEVLAEPQAQNDRAVDRMFESMQKAGELRTDVPPREMRELYLLIFSDRVARWLASDDVDVNALEDAVVGSLEILFRGLRAPDLEGA